MSEIGKHLIDVIKEAIRTGDTGRTVRSTPDVKSIRKKIKITQKEFSERYLINLDTLKAWEQHKRIPDSISSIYLSCIEKNPKVMYSLVREVNASRLG